MEDPTTVILFIALISIALMISFVLLINGIAKLISNLEARIRELELEIDIKKSRE